MLINFGWFRHATNPPLSAAVTGVASWPVIGGFPMFELSILLLLVVGGAYYLAVQRHRTISQRPGVEPEPSPLTVGGP